MLDIYKQGHVTLDNGAYLPLRLAPLLSLATPIGVITELMLAEVVVTNDVTQIVKDEN